MKHSWDDWPQQPNGLPAPAPGIGIDRKGQAIPFAMRPGFWADGPVYIVGGGPSLHGFDFSRLRGRNVLAINSAYLDCPFAQLLYFHDTKWWTWHRDRDAFRAFLGLILSFSFEATLKDPRIGRVVIDGMEGWSDTPSACRSGKNGGYVAIQIAAKLGARDLVLLGFDQQRVGARTHYHDDHRAPTPDRAYDVMLEHWPALADALAARGISVVNACPTSRIACFPKAEIEEVL